MFEKETEIRRRICWSIISEMAKHYKGDLIGFKEAKNDIERMLRIAEKQMRSEKKIDTHELINTIY